MFLFLYFIECTFKNAFEVKTKYFDISTLSNNLNVEASTIYKVKAKILLNSLFKNIFGDTLGDRVRF